MTNTDTTIVIPALETERTILRAHRSDDFEAYARMWAEPEVVRFIGGKPRTRAESWVRFLRHAGMWHMLGFGFWAIEEKGSGRFIGEAGFHDVKRDMTPSVEGLPEAGWSLVPDMHGRGLATEVVSAVLAWGDRVLPGRRQVCVIDPEHKASIGVARKCGFINPIEAQFEGGTLLLFERISDGPQDPARDSPLATGR